MGLLKDDIKEHIEASHEFFRDMRSSLLHLMPDGSSFEVFGRQYAKFFGRHGITLETIPYSGSDENIARFLDRTNAVQVAFVQGGY